VEYQKSAAALEQQLSVSGNLPAGGCDSGQRLIECIRLSFHVWFLALGYEIMAA
jgi:hypothetical protein